MPSDEIERLRAEISLYHQIRIDYCNAWSKWIDEHDHLDAMEWCRAYSNAVPHPNPDGPEVYQLIHSRLDAKFRQAADEIELARAELVTNADELAATVRELRKVEAERDEARRENCRMAVDLYVDESLEDETLEDAAMILAERKGWDCFKENKR